MASGGSGAETSPGRARWKTLATESLNINAFTLVLLAALAIVSFIGGWVLRPPDISMSIPSSPKIVLYFDLPQPLPGLNVNELLVQNTGSSADQMTITVTARGPVGKKFVWIMAISGFTGNFCRTHSQVSRIGNQDYLISGVSQIPVSGEPEYPNSLGKPFVVLDLCWSNEPLVKLSDSYFDAALPAIAAPNQTGTLTSVLEVPGTSLFDYSPSGGAAPTAESQQAWSWTTALSSSFASPGSFGILVYGSSTTGIEHETHNLFYSGILFGIAGGAALSMLAALPNLMDRRKESRPAGPQHQGPTAPQR